MGTVLIWWAVLCLAAYGMYVVAWLFESRVPGRDVPIWCGQSKAFVPGDIGLALFVAISPHKTIGWLWAILGFCMFATAFVVVRYGTYNPDDYTKGQWHSPSKRYHDFVICAVFGFGAAFWWPDILHPRQYSSTLIVGGVGLAVWIGAVIYDVVRKDLIDTTRQHPDVWQPLWC